MLENITIILVNTTHPGNIGGTARAMKNMGLTDLRLVDPKIFPSEVATARASRATDLLDNAQLFNDLESAVADCQLVVGTSARERHIPWPLINPRQLAAIAAPLPETTRVAVVFGREDRGLTNEELQLCHHHVNIPTNEEFSSLNIAAAVQVIAYELRMAALEQAEQAAGERPQWGTDWDIELAEHRELELMFEHLESVLVDIDFLDPNNPRQLMPRLRRLLLRAVPDKVEVNVLRGILKAVEKKLEPPAR
ncbi:RNA methyltransferase [Marinobacterium arenosum]|uniref:RNA methyltransferase n=1 Tax=Marinobacterium arenosum TaxID=2862496 RepID=UPI001C96EFE8|nr:RNA methyltransferase [Marinobacterium arenosum]MBY4678869.1 RNA methyltransferase [Marinobacterium arenosum]